jgi:P pilus assembly chaperone PapD
VAKRSQTNQLKPAGVDWQIPSASPSTVVVIPDVPEGEGGRQLVVTNPGPTRASVAVQVLGFQGPYEPSGAASLDVPPESTATVSLEEGLADQAGGVKLTSNAPVTGVVISTSRRSGAGGELAVQSAAVSLIRTGVSALATSNIADSQLIVSNSGDGDAQITFELFSYDGVTLRTEDILLAPNSTATRRLNSPAPSYVVVKVPDGSSVVGGVVLTQPDRNVAGLATIPLVSPDLASRAPATRPDYATGR